MPSRSRSPSPYTKRASRSYNDDRRRSSRSSSPRPRHRSRSRSPRRRHNDERPKKSSGGFRWKEKPRQDDFDDEGTDDRRLARGYREKERPRQRSPPRDDIEAKFGRQRSPIRGKEEVSDGNGVKDKFGEDPDKDRPKKEKKKKPAMAQTSQEMIIVNVNDRLGTKASIPCLASDPISMSFPSSRLSWNMQGIPCTW